MKEHTRAYVAGLIDAEGCLSISRAQRSDGYIVYDPLIRLTTTHRPTIEWVVKNFGGYSKARTWDESRWKEYYQWRFSSDKHASRFLSSILPYITLKKKEAKVLVQYYEMAGRIEPSVRESLFQKITDLKQRNSVTTNTVNFPWKTNLVNAYLAGFFDGEGSIFIIRAKQGRGFGFYYRVGICLGNTERRIVSALQMRYGGVFRERPPHNGVLPMFQWDLTRVEDQELFLLAILPYLKIKREQGILALNMLRLRGQENPTARHAIYEKVRILNGKKIESDLTGDRESLPVVTQNS